MKSHFYQVTARDCVRLALPTLIVLTCLAVLLRAVGALGLLPARPLTVDPNFAVLAHQSRAARSPHPARIVLAGDSTCLADVDASQLSARLLGHPRVLNLGLIIWLDFRTYAEVVTNSVAANPGQVQAVVLLVTPQKLAAPQIPAQQEFWKQARLYESHSVGGFLPADPVDLLGLKFVRENIIANVLATPIPGHGEGAARFGFSSEYDAYMTAHDGSRLDLGRVVSARRPNPPGWSFADDLEAQTTVFRASLPSDIKLVVGLTPVARSYSPTGDRVQRLEMLNQWNRWLKADALLTNLPAAWPDPFFSTWQHLNENGQRRFTSLLADQLAPLLAESLSHQR